MLVSEHVLNLVSMFDLPNLTSQREEVMIAKALAKKLRRESTQYGTSLRKTLSRRRRSASRHETTCSSQQQQQQQQPLRTDDK